MKIVLNQAQAMLYKKYFPEDAKGLGTVTTGKRKGALIVTAGGMYAQVSSKGQQTLSPDEVEEKMLKYISRFVR